MTSHHKAKNCAEFGTELRRRRGALSVGQTSEQYCRSCTDTVRLIQGKWKIHILCAMRVQPVRLGQLTRDLPVAFKKVLTEDLRQLEEAGMIIRTDFAGSVRHVEYDYRSELRPAIETVLDQLAEFGGVRIKPSDLIL